MALKVELKQLVGTISTAAGMFEEPQAVDAIKVNGVLAGYIDRRPNARIYGLRPVVPESQWANVAAEVKKLRPDADISAYSGVSQEAIDAANAEDEPDEDDDVE